jgi:putative phage-type endonuclease
VIQNTPEWFEARLGKVTASRVSDVVARTKSGYGASRANYMAQLVAERLTGEVAASFTNAAMQWGTDQEPDARTAYEFATDVAVSTVGFVPHPLIAMSGASPDGMVGDDGMVEFKCPNTAKHIETLINRTVDGDYVTQMQWQMACADRQWCDFVSYDPRLPASMQLYVQRVKRDEARIGELEKEVRAFLAELDGKVATLRELYETRAAA